jgi:DNA-binding transcriptional ArsR family regulator
MAVKLNLLGLDNLTASAECLKVLAHPVRLRIVDILMQGEFAVGELATLCELPPHQMSEHLRLMHGHGLLSANRRGRTVYYAISDPNLPCVIKCFRDNWTGRKGRD